MNTTQTTEYTSTTLYPAAYRAAQEAYARNASDDEAYAAAQQAATAEAGSRAALSAMNAAYEATMQARSER